jgi:hypothetical protein
MSIQIVRPERITEAKIDLAEPEGSKDRKRARVEPHPKRLTY